MKLELEEIYKTYFQDVYYFVLAMNKDPHIAEEITQETFFKALKGVKHFQGKCSIKSWLCQIARNEYISYTRKKHRTDQGLTEQAYSDGKTDGPEQRMLRKDEAMTVYQILHYLDEPYKEVFTLKVLGELKRDCTDIWKTGDMGESYLSQGSGEDTGHSGKEE